MTAPAERPPRPDGPDPAAPPDPDRPGPPAGSPEPPRTEPAEPSSAGPSPVGPPPAEPPSATPPPSEPGQSAPPRADPAKAAPPPTVPPQTAPTPATPPPAEPAETASPKAALPKAAIVTFGCKVNQYESSALAGELAAAGYEAAAAEEADVVVVNTCTVTDKADREALRLIRRLKRRRPGALVVATGCLAQADPAALSGPGLADLVLGQAAKARLAESLSLPRGTVDAGGLGGPVFDPGDPAPARTRAFHRIQDGCSESCAYCAVPLARGPSRSLALGRVLAGLSAHLARGAKEIVLTGVHLGRWGLDLKPRSDLAELLGLCGPLLSAHGARLRLSSLEPLEVPMAAPLLMSGVPWLAPHLHSPLQSGSDRILSAMGRPYRIAEAMAPLLAVKRARPDLGLGTDLICGFPGETEADFEATSALVESAPFGRLHVFPFSPRRGTRAASMPGQVPEAAKRERVAALRRLGAAKEAEFLRSQAGRPRRALVENGATAPGRGPMVLTDNYIRAVLPPDSAAAPGTLVDVILGPPAKAGDPPSATEAAAGRVGDSRHEGADPEAADPGPADRGPASS